MELIGDWNLLQAVLRINLVPQAAVNRALDSRDDKPSDLAAFGALLRLARGPEVEATVLG